jgi:L-fuculose-phosphate aldolase/L-ribulose-5-phosphate 4-epimerase
VHAHATFATVFASIQDPIPVILAEAAPHLGGPVPVAPYRRTGTEALARIAVETLREGPAALLANHGLLTVGPDLHSAYLASLAAERTAQLVCLARSMGSEPTQLNPAEVEGLRDLLLRTYHPTPLEGR